MVYCTMLVIAGALFASVTAGQLLPPPGDGDIRAVYWELRKESEVWLTLEPKTAKGDRAPLLTFTLRFAGQWPAGPPTEIDVRAYAGAIWAPRVELWLLLDESQRVDLGSRAKAFGLISGTPSDYLSEPISIDTLRQIAGAHRITGSALGLDFELSESQRLALGAFLERVLSDNPAQQPRRQPEFASPAAGSRGATTAPVRGPANRPLQPAAVR